MHLIVAGAPGVGKTTAAHALAARLGIPACVEDADANPYLGRFSEEPSRWALRSQLWFLLHAMGHHARIATTGAGGVQDHSYYEAFGVFACVQRDLGYLSDEDLELLAQANAIGDQILPAPDLVLHLTAPLDVLTERVSKRSRSYEGFLDDGYLAALDGRRRDMLTRWDRSPLVAFDTSAVDLRRSAGVDVLVDVVTSVLGLF